MGKKKEYNTIKVYSDSIEKLLDYYVASLKAANRSPKTVSWYLEILKRFFAFLSAESILKVVQDMGAAELTAYVLYLQQAERWPNKQSLKAKGRLSDYSIQGHVRAVKAFWSWLYDEGYIDQNPLIKYPLPSVTKKIVQTLSMEQIKRLLNAVDKVTPLGSKYYCILLLLVDAGLRISELVNIKLADLDLVIGLVKVTGKGRKERIVPFYKITRKELQKYINHLRPQLCTMESPYLFPTTDGDHVSVGSVQQYIRRLARKAGLQGIKCSPHVFRHTFATQATVNEATAFTLKEIMGHESLQTTLKYTHLKPGDLKAQHNKFSPVASVFEGN